MSAAAQPARKGTTVPIPDWFNSNIDRNLWVAIPWTALQNLSRKLGPVERDIYLQILRLTVGNHNQNRPEQIRITHDELAEWANVDKRQITKSLKWLRENKVIEGEERGRYVLYKVLDFTLASLPNRSLRTVNQPEEVEEEVVEDAEEARKEFEVVEFQSSKPMTAGGTCKIKLPREKVVERIAFTDDRTLAAGAMRGGFKGTLLQLAVNLSGLSQDHGTRVPRSARQQGEQKDNGTPVPLLKVPAALIDAFVPVFEDRFHQAPDQALLTKVATDLGSTPVPYFLNLVRLKFDSGYKVTPGLFFGNAKTPGLAKEAAEKWAKLSPGMQQRYLPRAAQQPKPQMPAFDAEPESSKSDWSRIRARLKAKLAPQEYENWVQRTRQVSSAKGRLVIAVVDEVTAEYIEQEFEGFAVEAARALNLDIREFIWEVQ